MSKNIVVCCDGTGNEVEGNLSNVLKLFRIAQKNEHQRVYYNPGIGTIGSRDAWMRLKQNTKAVFGLVTGYGLDGDILGAYRFIAQQYEKDDSIFLFGFSRGAYTVRALAGFIHMVGLLPPDQLNIADYALTAYKRASEENDLSIAWNFNQIAGGRRATIKFIGAWDTVASVLVPRRDRIIPTLLMLPYTRVKAIVEGGTGTAARTAGLLGGILSFAVSEGVIPFNPATGVKRPADNRRQRRLTADEYKALGKALGSAEADAETAQGIKGAWLLALTGCRLGEVENLKWAEVDDDGGCFRLEDSKEGASVRPIGRPVFDVLATIERQKENPFVLTALRGKGAFGGMPGAWRRIVKRAELEGVTPHTLRHSYASVAGDLGFTESTIAAMLGHAAGSVTSRYVHHLDSVLIAAADKVARTIHGMMTGAESKVVQLPNRKRKA